MFLLALTAVLCTFSAQVHAQSLLTGDIAGTVTDPSGAVIPGATVNLQSLETGTSATTTTNASGVYRFSLLKPGRYQVTVTQPGFQKAERQTTVAVGQIVTTNLSLAVGQATQTVEVEAAAPLVNPQPSVNTTFTPAEVQQLPSPGGDITNIAETAPGVNMNTTGTMQGYGNFTLNGLPATSNLFTINGENDMDPYFNINNSGATNLTLGQNEIQEATVIANPYSGEYGQLAGAQVSYVTKSGSNQFHGNALYYWNGRYVNANDWFNNAYGVDRPFSNANQWAASVGGPIRKNSTFFFVDTEGLRFVLPNEFTNTIPTQAFQSAVLANVGVLQPSEVSTYQQMFNLYNSAPNAASAQPIPNNSACNALSLPGFDPSTQACAATFRNSASTLGTEWILAGRVDQRIGNNDNAYFRYKADHGTQPTLLSPISPDFNAISHQPSYDMQFNETHVFGPNSTNSFMATFSHYVAQFQQNYQAATSTFPYAILTSGTVPFTGFNPLYEFPQGRNISQYQFIDDFSHIHGNHNLKFGVNFRRYDVSDHNFFFNSPTVYFGYVNAGLQQYADGLAFQYRQSLNLASDVPVALWGIGFYGQDEWKVRPNLTLTLALRAERNSNPVCQFDCFANFTGPWNGLASVSSADPTSVPYSADIATGLHQAFMGVDALDLSPRIGFSWSPWQGQHSTVLSGGIGIFYDNPAAGLVDDLLGNPPISVSLRVRPSGGVAPFAPGPNGGAAIYAASASAFNVNESYGQISSALTALGSVFSPPGFTALEGTIHAPRWEEWNLQLQHQLTNSLVLVLGYSGNHGIRILYDNPWSNAFDRYGIFPGVPGILEASGPPVPNYSNVDLIQNGGISNYNGLTVTVRKQFSHWFSALANYTWSHNLDDVSNGGIFPYSFALGATQVQVNPLSLSLSNYGNSDYDIRHSFNAAWVVNPSWHFSNSIMKDVLGGWQWSGKWFWRSGLPFSVVDGNWNGAITDGGSTIYATPIASNMQTGCGHGNTQDVNGLGTPCLNAGAFLNSGSASFTGFTQWPPQGRNAFRGPGFFDIDMALYKTFPFGESRNVGIGIQAFNVFNHPNFGLPDNNLGDSTFGLISGMAGVPTSPYGNFLGFDSSPRVVQLSAKLVF
jgi:outer membrane receptor protein involved in Fe transport